MRKKIYRLSEGQFDSRQINIASSVDKIDITLDVGAKLEGSFDIFGEDDQSIRGVIYSTNPYIITRDYQFDGVRSTIKYSLKHSNFKKNDILEGCFIVVGNGSTLEIPIKITFVRKTIKSSIGEINSLDDFGRLCQENFIEANNIFHTDAFIDIIDDEDVEKRLLYLGYRRSVPSLNNLEEFLVACKLKDRIDITLDKESAEYNDICENQKEEIVITKSTWGNVEIDVSIDADFVTIEKEHIDSDYFLGSKLHFDYYIHKNRMHKGTNLAKISFDTINQHKEFLITARLEGEDTYVDFSYQDKKRRKVEFLYNYEEYRLRHITTAQWAEKSIQLIDTFITDIRYAMEEGIEPSYDKCGADVEFYELMKAHAYIANGQKQEALWIIQKIKRDISDKKSVKWAYLLYLCTLIEPEPSYVDRLTNEIEVIFRSHPDDVRVFWFLLFLRNEYSNNNSRKLKDITQWLNNGYDTPYLYVEAYAIYRQDPYLIKDISPCVIKILNWIRRHNAFTEDISDQFMALLNVCSTYDERLYKIACAAYEANPTNSALEIIVGYLMRTNSYGEKFLRWYELCLYKEMRITGVYEAYLMCLEGEHLVNLPQVLLMYFKYQSNMSYDKKAIVYSNVVLHKNDFSSLYQQYLRTIELFAIEQMQYGRIDDSLAIIYQDVLDNGIINEDVAAGIAPLLHTARISVARDDITRVLVVSEQLENPVIAPVRNNVCYVPIFAKNFCIFLEDKKGVLHSSAGDYMYEFLLKSDALVDNLKKLSPESMPYVIRFFDELKDSSLPAILRGKDDETLKIEDLHCVETFISSKAISSDYKAKLYPLLIYFLQKHGREDMIERHLCEEVSFDRIDAEVLSYIIDLFISTESYDRAYYLVSTYNGSYVEKKYINKLCSYMIKEDVEETTSSFFVSLCASIIGSEELDPDVCNFLCEEYVGPNDKMIMLWKEGVKYNIDTHKLEDRILVQMFYSEDISDAYHDIFKSYVSSDYNKMLVEAVLTYFANKYINEAIDDLDEFDASFIFRQYNRSDKLNDACKIALMKHLCFMDNLKENELNILDSLVREYVVKNVYFSFFKNMDRQLIIKYHLYDKQFAEYHGNANERINIIYKKNEDDIQFEEMLEMYPGIYVKQFVLFFGDNIYYEVHRLDEEDVLKKDVLVYNDIINDGNSRYDRINKMQSDLLYNEEKDLLEEMKEYQGLDYVTKQLFARV